MCELTLWRPFSTALPEGYAGNVCKVRFWIDPGNDDVDSELRVDDVTFSGGGSCDPCDANCDGSVDLTDVEPFIGLLLGGEPCAECTGDTNNDGSVDLLDVEGFIGCLLG